MNKLLFSFLKVLRFFKKLKLKIAGRSEEDFHDQRITSGKAWEEFCEELKLAGSVLKFPGTPQDPFNQAEGVRYLTRLTRAALEAYVEFNDPAFPVLRRTVHETIKMGADNPDNYYFNAQISGEYEYRIKGKRNTVHYVGFFTQNGNYGTTGGLAPCGTLEGSDLKLKNDGSFEIILSKTKKGENWLKIEDETTLLMVRQTFLDKRKEVPAELKIETLNGKKKPEPLTPKQMDESLKTASLFVAGSSLLFAKWAKGFKKHVNKLPLFDPAVSNAAGGDKNIIYYHGYWKLEEDEALVITVRPPECDLWNFQLNNYWMESLDYRYFTVSINKGNAVTDPDGKVKVIISSRDPGLPNRLETAGHREGTMCWRWYRLAPGATPVEPECKVVKINELKNEQ
jgi:hypothetical protein